MAPFRIVVAAIFLGAAATASSAAARAGGQTSSCVSGDAPGGGRSQAMLQHASGAGAVLMEDLASKHPRRGRPAAQGTAQVGLLTLPQKLSWWTQKGHANQQVELLMKSMSSAGQEPDQKGISNYIRHELLPQAEQTKEEMQTSIDMAASGISECSTALQGAESKVREQETSLMIGEQRHSECMVMEGQKKKLVTEKCEDLSTFSSSLSSPQASLKGANASNTDDIIDQTRGMSEYYNDIYPKFMEKKKACDDTADQEGSQEMECDADKTGIEGAYCNLKSQRSRVCQGYSECWGLKILHYDKVAANVKDLEEHMKGNYKALACFRIGDSDDGEKEDESCDPEGVDVSHLTIIYPDKPEKEACTTTVKTNWNYTGVECPQSTEVAVSEDAQSPTSAPEEANDEATSDNATEEAAPANATTGDDSSNTTGKLLQASAHHRHSGHKSRRQSGPGHGR